MNYRSSPNTPSTPTPSTPLGDEFDPPFRGLLDQRVFLFDRVGFESLANQGAIVLIQAIAIAHRLIFSPKSLRILNFWLGSVLASEKILPNDWHYGLNPLIGSAINALAMKDDMVVIIDRKTHQDGFVRYLEPKGLRVTATVSSVKLGG
jgi:hypothetical protein